MLGYKLSQPIQEFTLSNIPNAEKEVNQIVQQQFSLKAVFLNSYRRAYWGTRDGKFRITIDSDMRFHSLLHSPNFFKYIHKDKVVVVELKYDEIQ